MRYDAALTSLIHNSFQSCLGIIFSLLECYILMKNIFDDQNNTDWGALEVQHITWLSAGMCQLGKCLPKKRKCGTCSSAVIHLARSPIQVISQTD